MPWPFFTQTTNTVVNLFAERVDSLTYAVWHGFRSFHAPFSGKILAFGGWRRVRTSLNEASEAPLFMGRVWFFSTPFGICQVEPRDIRLLSLDCNQIHNRLSELMFVRPLSGMVFMHTQTGRYATYSLIYSALFQKLDCFDAGFCNSRSTPTSDSLLAIHKIISVHFCEIRIYNLKKLSRINWFGFCVVFLGNTPDPCRVYQLMAF